MSELQLIIEVYIRENGGADKLANQIESEWCKSFYARNNYYTNSETIFLLANYHTKTADYIARRLGRSYLSVKKKINCLREKSMIDYKNINNVR